MVSGIYGVTPVERHGNIFIKRDDLFSYAGVSGGKVRAAIALCKKAKEEGFGTVVTCGSRVSPQLLIVAAVSSVMGLRCVGFTAKGTPTNFTEAAIRSGMDLRQVKCGYSNVLQKRVSDYASEHDTFEVPFGMRSEIAVELARIQTVATFNNCPELSEVKRIVVVAGSGVNLSGILIGLNSIGSNIKVLAVLVGHDCSKFVINNAPFPDMVSFARSPQSYYDKSHFNQINGLTVDSRYEGKAIPFLQVGDLFWVIGNALGSAVNNNRLV